MAVDNKILEKLNERFSRDRNPLDDCYRRRIIFWSDEKHDFADDLDDIESGLPDGVKLLRLTGTNFFEAKRTLLDTDTESDYLVYKLYDADRFASPESGWMRDIELYSEEFRADKTSMNMDALDIADTPELRRVADKYGKFLGSETRRKKLLALHREERGGSGHRYEKADLLVTDIMAVLCGAKENTRQGVLCRLIHDSITTDSGTIPEDIGKYGGTDDLLEMTKKYTGYGGDEFDPLRLTDHIINKAFTLITGDGTNNKTAVNCHFIISGLTGDNDDDVFGYIMKRCEETGIMKKLEDTDTETLTRSDCLPCIDAVLINRYMAQVSEGVIRADEITAIVDRRRPFRWYERYRDLYDCLFYIAQMKKFNDERERTGGYNFGTRVQLWNKYKDEYYLMDSYYRHFRVAAARCGEEYSSGTTDDLAKKAADVAEHMYKTVYLEALCQSWDALTEQSRGEEFLPGGIKPQERFYKEYVAPLIYAGNRVFVIISDALRYEVAAELRETLIRETKGTAEIDAALSVFPSSTKFGMAALLPHSALTYEESGGSVKVLCDGEDTGGTENREKILKKKHSKNRAVTYDDIMNMSQSERREYISGSQVVYIYHNTIDAVGDEAASRHKVFGACSEAVAELSGLVRMICNSVNGTHVIITADHGFLYSREKPDETDKADADLVSGKIIEKGKRYIIASAGSSSGIMAEIPLTARSDKMTGFSPRGLVRIKIRGGGSNYVHGGTSLQECCVPVITFKNTRSRKNQGVQEKALLTLVNDRRVITGNLFTVKVLQNKPVGDKVVPATYEIYLCDSGSDDANTGNKVSDVRTVVADKTGDNPERVTTLHFTVKGGAARKGEYYIRIVEKGQDRVLESTPVTVNISFENDFDF